MFPPYKVRPARPGDISRLPAIERAAGSLFTAAGIGGDISVLSAEVHATACAEGRLLVAADGADQPVGFLLMDGDHLAEMDVHPDHGRRGIGAALLGAALDRSRRAGRPHVTLTTYRDLPWNAPFYARHGFSIVPPSAWTPALAAHAEEEGVRPGSGRVAMICRF